ncbi:Uncharacterised protein [Mycobacterium tuberculosis]|nr:Uncharacterised protein [Mycobacterium tuberculosis]
MIFPAAESTATTLSTKRAAAIGQIARAALHCKGTEGSEPQRTDPLLVAAWCGAGPCRRLPAGLAAAAAAGGSPAVRRRIAQLESGAPRCRPGRAPRSAGLRGRQRDGRIRRAARGTAGGFTGPPGWATHQLRAGSRPGPGRSAGVGAHRDRRAGGRAPRVPGRRLSALGGDVGPGFGRQLCRSAGPAEAHPDTAKAAIQRRADAALPPSGTRICERSRRRCSGRRWPSEIPEAGRFPRCRAGR